MFLTKTKATPRKSTRELSPGTAANSTSPAFSPAFSSTRLSMRRGILSRSSSTDSASSYAERMEQKWVERVKDEDVSYAWLWVA